MFNDFVLFVLCAVGVSQLIECSDAGDQARLAWKCSNDTDCPANHSFCEANWCLCQEGYIYSADLTTCLKVASSYGDECEESIQCSAYLLAGGACINGKCGCTKGYHYLHGYCFKSSGLGEACRSPDYCYVNYDSEAATCEENTCRCSDNFYQREHRNCRRKANELGDECAIDQDCVFNSLVVCDKIKGCQSKYHAALYELPAYSAKNISQRSTIRIGSLCNSAADCETLGSSTCGPLGTCICNRAHFPSTNGDKCISELGESCTSGESTEIKNAICRDGRWSCKGATVATVDNRGCKKVTTKYNSSCLLDEQCYVFGPDALCSNKRCICNDNSHYVASKLFCWINRGLGESCLEDEDCYVKGRQNIRSICDAEFTCACPYGTHISADKSTCIKDNNPIGGACTGDEDCSVKHSVCQENSCVCADNYYKSYVECLPGILAPCMSNFDCYPKNSSCTNNTCMCADRYVSPAINLCVPVSGYGEFCIYDVQCNQEDRNAVCEKFEVDSFESNSIYGKCACKEGYHSTFGYCLKKKVLNEPCQNRGECYVDSPPYSVHCENGFCRCASAHIQTTATYCLEQNGATHLTSHYVELLLIALSATLLSNSS